MIRTCHILTDTNDSIPVTGDAVAMLNSDMEDRPAQLFVPGRAAKLLTAKDVTALKHVHALLTETDQD